jgi:hypothetical protein
MLGTCPMRAADAARLTPITNRLAEDQDRGRRATDPMTVPTMHPRPIAAKTVPGRVPGSRCWAPTARSSPERLAGKLIADRPPRLRPAAHNPDPPTSRATHLRAGPHARGQPLHPEADNHCLPPAPPRGGAGSAQSGSLRFHGKPGRPLAPTGRQRHAAVTTHAHIADERILIERAKSYL